MPNWVSPAWVKRSIGFGEVRNDDRENVQISISIYTYIYILSCMYIYILCKYIMYIYIYIHCMYIHIYKQIHFTCTYMYIYHTNIYIYILYTYIQICYPPLQMSTFLRFQWYLRCFMLFLCFGESSNKKGPYNTQALRTPRGALRGGFPLILHEAVPSRPIAPLEVHDTHTHTKKGKRKKGHSLSMACKVTMKSAE